MSTPIRYRTDNSLYAELTAKVRDDPAFKLGLYKFTKAELKVLHATPPAEPGDAWRLEFHQTDKLAGFAICCPKCRQLHYWSSANNCSSKRKYTFTDSEGHEHEGMTCDHQQAKTSCWTWTLDETGKPVQAVASLFANGEGHCGYHGWLKDGALTDG